MRTEQENGRTFYQLQTFVMRRPESYEEISQAVSRAICSGKSAEPPAWLAERKTWPAEMKAVLQSMSYGMMLLIFHHSSLVRYARTAWRLARWHARARLKEKELERQIMKRIPQDTSTKQLVKAKRRVDRLQLAMT